MHNPVMLNEVIEYLSPKDGETYVDMTFGMGGYSKAILDSANCNLFSFDRDNSVAVFADKLSKEYPNRFTFINRKFSEIEEALEEKNIAEIDGVVFDLGVSSMHLDKAERGFSFNKEARLDMRMGEGDYSAYNVVNEKPEKELADIIYHYGDERKSRSIARTIVAKRPIETTTELASIIASVVRKKKDRIHPATKSFQAIRIYVNNELEEFEIALKKCKTLLKIGGRLVVVNFHGLEDKIIKKFLRDHSGASKVSRYHIIDDVAKKSFKSLHGKAVKPSDAEINDNPRARSAKLRAAIKIGQV